MAILEFTLIAALALWVLASFGHCFLPARGPALARWNRQYRACCSWRLFSAAAGEMPSGILELDYRDRPSARAAAPWITVRDSGWSWHAFLWMPERRVTNRIFHLIRELAGERSGARADAATLPRPARLLAQHLCRRDPPRGGDGREFRLVVRDRPGGITVETLFTFCTGADGHAR